MGFQLRQTDGSTFSSSSWIEPDGSLTSYGNMEFIARPLIYILLEKKTSNSLAFVTRG